MTSDSDGYWDLHLCLNAWVWPQDMLLVRAVPVTLKCAVHVNKPVSRRCICGQGRTKCTTITLLELEILSTGVFCQMLNNAEINSSLVHWIWSTPNSNPLVALLPRRRQGRRRRMGNEDDNNFNSFFSSFLDFASFSCSLRPVPLSYCCYICQAFHSHQTQFTVTMLADLLLEMISNLFKQWVLQTKAGFSFLPSNCWFRLLKLLADFVTS